MEDSLIRPGVSKSGDGRGALLRFCRVILVMYYIVITCRMVWYHYV